MSTLNRRTLITRVASCAVVPALPATAVASGTAPAAVAVASPLHRTAAEDLARFRHLFGLLDDETQKAVTTLMAAMVEADKRRAAS